MKRKLENGSKNINAGKIEKVQKYLNKNKSLLNVEKTTNFLGGGGGGKIKVGVLELNKCLSKRAVAFKPIYCLSLERIMLFRSIYLSQLSFTSACFQALPMSQINRQKTED